MVSHKQKFSVHMVKNSRPVGRVFKRKKHDFKNKRPPHLGFKVAGRHNALQKISNNTDGRNKFMRSGRDEFRVVNRNAELEKTTNLNGTTSLEIKNSDSIISDSSSLQTLKRKGSEIDSSTNQGVGGIVAPLSDQKQPEKVNEKSSPLPNQKIGKNVNPSPNPKQIEENKTSNPAVVKKDGLDVDENKTESTVGGGVKAGKRRRKKKKKMPSESGTTADDGQYKPVWVIRKPEDISANWKNLKDSITRSDKAKAVTSKNVEHKSLPRKQTQVEVFKDKKEAKKRKRMSLEELVKEQEKQAEEYETLREKQQISKSGKKEKKKKLDVWFDNVDPILLGEEYNDDDDGDDDDDDDAEKDLEADKPEKVCQSKEELENSNTKAVAMDCEMVGVGIDGKESVLARVSIVNQYCKVIYDKYVKPQEEVVDYRTEFSGIRPGDLKNAHDFKEVQSEVAKILEGKILVGHGLQNDLRCLFLRHPRSRIRDSAKYKPFKTMFRGSIPKLKMLTKKILGVDIQSGEHDSVQDAQAAMRIYTLHRSEWEKKKKKVYDKPTKKSKITPEK